MWTDKYAPCRANEVIGNWVSCKRLRDWLTQWKEMIDRIEKASRQSASKQRGHKNTGGSKSDGIFYSVLDCQHIRWYFLLYLFPIVSKSNGIFYCICTKKPKSQSFQLASGHNPAGLFFMQMCIVCHFCFVC